MTQDTRKDRRVKIVSLNVRYKSATVDEFIENHAHDVSRGGIYIKTANPFPPGTLLKFEIRLASDQAVIAGVGRIVWKRDVGGSSSERPAGMGVKFIKIDEPSRAVIDRLVNSRSDAGKSYETSEDATQATDRVKTLPPQRPSSPIAAESAASTDSSSSAPPMGPPAGEHDYDSDAHTMTTQAGTPFARKATMVGLGATVPAPATASTTPPPGPAITAPGRGAFSNAPTVPPRPGTGYSAMFPKSESERPAPQEELTVMKQAAELLEDALREAGGSMAEVGQNPLFAGSPSATSASARKAISPETPAGEWTTADTPQALAATVAALRAEEAASKSSGRPSAEDTGRTRARPSTATASDAGAARATKKGVGPGMMILMGIAVAAALVLAVTFGDKLVGEKPPPEPAVISVAPAPPPATALASAPVVTVPAAPIASAPPEPPANVVASPAATAAATASVMDASIQASKTALAPEIRPRPAVAAKPATAPQASGEAPAATGASAATAATSSATGTSAAAPATSSESKPASTASAPAKSAPIAPKPKPSKPADDNPY